MEIDIKNGIEVKIIKSYEAARRIFEYPIVSDGIRAALHAAHRHLENIPTYMVLFFLILRIKIK